MAQDTAYLWYQHPPVFILSQDHSLIFHKARKQAPISLVMGT